MSILVTGGAGYVGSFTVRALQQQGKSVVVLDNLSTGHKSALHPDTIFYQGDINNESLLKSIIKTHAVEALIHFAASSLVGISVVEPAAYFQNNTASALVLFDTARRLQVKHVVFSSTAAVYGEPNAIPIDEDHPKNPTNPYGLSKYFTEQILDTFDLAYGMKHVALRYFNACGAWEDLGEDHTPESHLIPLVLQTALGKREAISVFGTDYPTADGTAVRDYIHVLDLAKAHLAALAYLQAGGKSQKINLGNGLGYSVQDIIAAARSATGKEIPVQQAERRQGDPSTLIASAQKARDVLGWQPEYNLDSIIKSAWAWHKTHPDGYA